jgi:VanZ family protein
MAVLSRFAPPVALMGLIFFLSAQPHLATDLGFLDLVLRKLAHMTEYGVLALLWWRALRTRSPLPGAAIAVAYAVSDEFHQHFVEGRHGAPVDVLIDAAGVALAIAAYRVQRRRAANRAV